MPAADAQDALQVVLDKLDGVQSHAGYYMAQCPAHDDTKASLSVEPGETQPVLLNCLAGCSHDDVMAALGLKPDDIYAVREEREEWTPSGPAIAIYSYIDEQGELLFQVLRTADKQFPQRRPDRTARSGWSWKLGGVRRVPYRLPAVIAAAKAGARIFIVEGEKDVHSVERAGAIATTSPGGAGKWKPEYSQFFAGADVVIVADLDKANPRGRRPGIDHALQVQEALTGIARTVIVVVPVAGKDATDHLAAGHGLDEFEPFNEPVSATYYARMPIGKVMTAGIPKPKILEGLLYSGKLHSLAGPPEAGKTVLSLHLAIAVMRLGCNVVLWDEEGGPSQTASVLQALGAEPQLVDKHLFYYPHQGSQWTGKDVEELDLLIRGVRPRLSIWDSSAAMMSIAGTDENNSGEVTKFWSTIFGPVARTHGCAVLVLDHDGKNGGETSRYARGSGAKLAGVDVALKLNPLKPFNRNQDGILTLQVVKDRPGWLHRNFKIRVAHDPLRLQFNETTAGPASDSDMPPAQAKLLEALTDMPASIAQLVDRIADKHGHGLRHDTAQKELAELMKAGLADRQDMGPGRAALYCKGTNLLLPGDGIWPTGTVGSDE